MFLKKVDKKLLNNVGGKNVTSKRWTTNVDEQKCSLKRLIRNCETNVDDKNVFRKRWTKKWSKFPVLPGGRGNDKEKRGAEKRKQDSLHCAFALQDSCWHFNLIC